MKIYKEKPKLVWKGLIRVCSAVTTLDLILVSSWWDRVPWYWPVTLRLLVLLFALTLLAAPQRGQPPQQTLQHSAPDNRRGRRHSQTLHFPSTNRHWSALQLSACRRYTLLLENALKINVKMWKENRFIWFIQDFHKHFPGGFQDISRTKIRVYRTCSPNDYSVKSRMFHVPICRSQNRNPIIVGAWRSKHFLKGTYPNGQDKNKILL